MESNTSKQYEAYRPSMSKLPISLNTSIKPVHIATYASPLKLFSPSGYVQIPDPPHLERVREKDARLKRHIRLWKLVARIFTFLLAIYPLYSQALTLHKFLTTRDTIVNGRNAWAKETTIWPTILLLSTSGATVLVSMIILASYLRGIRHANKTNNTVGTAGFVIEMGAHIAVWIATAAAYRVGKTGNDLWGWTCSTKAAAIQSEFEVVINFQSFCDVQSYAWILSIVQAVALLVTALVYFLAWRRFKHKQQMELETSMMVPVKV
ncbi:hypothetical protein MMC19_000860 [Ptychographa xylographoides]|nr:hypothetical protein [Ptychographa xylographoides]